MYYVITCSRGLYSLIALSRLSYSSSVKGIKYQTFLYNYLSLSFLSDTRRQALYYYVGIRTTRINHNLRSRLLFDNLFISSNWCAHFADRELIIIQCESITRRFNITCPI